MFVSRREKKVVLQGTVTPCQDFNGEVEASKLRRALKSKNLSVVCDVLGKTSNSQRQEIKTLYKQQFGRDLEEDVKKTLSGDFEILCRALLMTPAEYDAYCLHKAMLGLGTHESVLIEILVTRTNEELIEIRRIYRAKYGKDLESDIKADTSGDFKKLMVSLANAERPEDATVDLTKAIKDAEALVHAGVARWGRDEETFNRVMATQSFRQLRAVFNSYDKLITEDIRADIKREFDGDVGNGLVAIVDFVRDRNAFFATKLNNALTKGMTRNDIHIIRIVVSRSEIDLRNIKRTYFEQYGKIFVDIVANQMTGEYQRLLLAILG